MNSDEITTFRAARPQVPPYDPDAKARLRSRLAEGTGPAESARRPGTVRVVRRRIVALGALTAALVVGVTVVQNIELGGGPTPGHTASGQPRRPLVLGPVANAEDLAHNAALKAATGPDARPRPDQWSYAESVMAGSSKGVGGRLFGPPDRRIRNELWRSADGTRSASIEKGRLQVRKLGIMEGSASPRSDYPYLLSLPDNADALLAEVYKVVDGEGGRRSTDGERASRAFQIIDVFMRDVALPAKLRAAMYGALAKIPGVRYQATAVDIAGRPGVTLYRMEEGYLRSEIIVNPKTFEYMGFRFIAVKDHVSRSLDMDSRIKKGQILGWGGLLKAAVVDRPGQRV